ncbi:MAG: FlgD immunoglobulin-like domain containing protein [Candidatus Eiseniibacteriota bacterium]
MSSPSPIRRLLFGGSIALTLALSILVLPAFQARAAETSPAVPAGVGPPCIEITVAPPVPGFVCPDEEVTFFVTVRNCSPDPEDVSVELAGAMIPLGILQPGATAVQALGTAMPPCTAGNSVSFEITAFASNAAGTATDTEVEIVGCSAQCIEVELAPLDPQCAGMPVLLLGTVRNCSPADEFVSVQLEGGGSQDVGVVHPGATAEFGFDAGPLACVGGSGTYSVTATATGGCGPDATDTAQATISCVELGVCIVLTLNPIPPQCVGTPIQITGIVQNCSSHPEEVDVLLEGSTPIHIGTLEPGAAAPISIDAGPLVCVSGGQEYVVTATASGSCLGTADDTDQVTVLCQPGPCVDLRLRTTPTRGCPGSSFSIPGLASNCAPFPETIQITGPGPTLSFEVAPGATVEFTFEMTQPACGPGGTTTIPIVAVATADCTPVTVSDTESFVMTCECPGGNCPRPVEFWAAQCGAVPRDYTAAHLASIAGCVDAASLFLTFPHGAETAGLCQALAEVAGDVRRTALREYAAVLANLCAGRLLIRTRDGVQVRLDESTQITCPSMGKGTIPEMLVTWDLQLRNLATQPLSMPNLNRYSRLTACMRSVNTGSGIPLAPGCGGSVIVADEPSLDSAGLTPGPTESSTGDFEGIVPNPFRGATRIRYAVRVDTPARVDIGIYDVAGRRVRALVAGTSPPGTHEAIWDGRDDAGVAMSPGVYFVRTANGLEKEVRRVVYLGP